MPGHLENAAARHVGISGLDAPRRTGVSGGGGKGMGGGKLKPEPREGN